MTQPLPPTAQAVMDAYMNRRVNSKQWCDGDGPCMKIAAAIRALVDAKLPEEPEPKAESFAGLANFTEAMGIWRTRSTLRQEFLAVADELEGTL